MPYYASFCTIKCVEFKIFKWKKGVVASAILRKIVSKLPVKCDY